jgi:hypothetical protein
MFPVPISFDLTDSVTSHHVIVGIFAAALLTRINILLTGVRLDKSMFVLLMQRLFAFFAFLAFSPNDIAARFMDFKL